MDANNAPAQSHRYSIGDSLRDDARTVSPRKVPAVRHPAKPRIIRHRKTPPPKRAGWTRTIFLPSLIVIPSRIRYGMASDIFRSLGLHSAAPRQVVDYPPQESRSSREPDGRLQYRPCKPIFGRLGCRGASAGGDSPGPDTFPSCIFEAPPRERMSTRRMTRPVARHHPAERQVAIGFRPRVQASRMLRTCRTP